MPRCPRGSPSNQPATVTVDATRDAPGGPPTGAPIRAKLPPVDGGRRGHTLDALATLRPRPVAASLEELVGDAPRWPVSSSDGKSGSRLERVELGGEPHILKLVHVDHDWIARSLGDVRCRPLIVWASGLLDAAPPTIDHTVVGAAGGLGRHGWGAALLMRDVGSHLVPPGDTPVGLAQHGQFLEHLAQLSARFWGWHDDIGLVPPTIRWTMFGDAMLAAERQRGFPDEVPRLADDGWRRFAARAPADVAALVGEIRRRPWDLAAAVATTPTTFLHGDWKMGNLGNHPDGRTILLDCAYPGEGPACHDLAWYLALNRARLPEPKEDAIERFRVALERHGVATDGWWERQLGLCLLGSLVQFGWEKALGPDDELGWWCDRVREGARWL